MGEFVYRGDQEDLQAADPELQEGGRLSGGKMNNLEKERFLNAANWVALIIINQHRYNFSAEISEDEKGRIDSQPRLPKE